jgi:hypothetical protein
MRAARCWPSGVEEGMGSTLASACSSRGRGRAASACALGRACAADAGECCATGPAHMHGRSASGCPLPASTQLYRLQHWILLRAVKH